MEPVENWRPIEGYEGYYEVSDLGRVRSLDRVVTMKNGMQRLTKGRVMKDVDGNSLGKYRGVTLSKNGNTKKFLLHRLVAKAFVPNDNGLEEINHIDEDKANNRASNLEWCDRKYNNTYGSVKFRAAMTQGRPVLQMDGDRIVNAWPSEGLAAYYTGASQSGISMCCRGEGKTSGGYGWRFAPWTGR